MLLKSLKVRTLCLLLSSTYNPINTARTFTLLWKWRKSPVSHRCSAAEESTGHKSSCPHLLTSSSACRLSQDIAALWHSGNKCSIHHRFGQSYIGPICLTYLHVGPIFFSSIFHFSICVQSNTKRAPLCEPCCAFRKSIQMQSKSHHAVAMISTRKHRDLWNQQWLICMRLAPRFCTTLFWTHCVLMGVPHPHWKKKIMLKTFQETRNTTPCHVAWLDMSWRLQAFAGYHGHTYLYHTSHAEI